MENNINMAESVHSLERMTVNQPAVSQQVCTKLISLTDDAYCTVKLYQGIFVHEPLIVSGVLRLANAQDLKKPVLTISEATSMLGWKKLRGIISAICLSGTNKKTNLTLDAVWEQSSLRTILAKLLALSTKEDTRDKVEKCCYVLALGKFQLAAQDQLRYAEVVDLVKSGCNLNEAEQAKFGFIASSMNAKLCQTLKLPSYFSNMMEEFMLGKTKDQAFEIITQAELLSVTMLHQSHEIEKVKAKLNINNLDKIIKTAAKEHQSLKKLSGY